MKIGTKYHLFIIISVLIKASIASACPASLGYPDVNCDEKFIISFFGDSVTRGVADPKMNNVTGGVPLRLKKYFKKNLPKKSFKVNNFGRPGIKCLDLKVEARREILKNKKGGADSDVAIYACGLNDYFTHRDSSKTRSYLQAMKRFAKKKGIFSNIAMVTQTNRPWQQPWVASVNAKLIKVASNIRYDLLDPETMISNDSLHPNGAGYNFMFDTLFSFINHTNFIPLAESELGLTDLDNDNVYDIFEITKFGTDPNNPDTDNDGTKDGKEIFNLRTDPLVANF